MATTTALELNKRLHQSIGDHLEVQVTTNIAANTTIMSTNLRKYDGGRNDYFVDWWVYITDKNNAGEDRKISNYYTANGGMVVFGSNFSVDSVQANIRVHRYSYTDAQVALNDAMRETYPILHKWVDDRQAFQTNNSLYEYAIPTWAKNGEIRQVLVNTYGTTDDYRWDEIPNWIPVNAGANIRMPTLFSTNCNVRLIGITPLETVTNSSDAVNIGDERINLLLAYTRYKLFQGIQGVVSSEDTERYQKQAGKAYTEYMLLKPRLGMSKPRTMMNFRTY